jgi:hypothetical protein
MDGIQGNNYRGGAGDIFFLSMYLTMQLEGV